MKAKAMSNEEATSRLLMILSRHMGRARTIGMGELYERVFRQKWNNRINDTRKLRTLITMLRNKGVPICSSVAQSGGGYYLASAGSEFDEFCTKMYRLPALKKLKQEAVMRKVALPELLGQIQMNLEG